MTTGESRWDYPDIEMIVPPPPPPADLEDGKDSCEGEQRVSCSSLNKPVVGDLVTNVTLPSAEVSTTTSDPHRVPDTSSKMEDVLEVMFAFHLCLWDIPGFTVSLALSFK